MPEVIRFWRQSSLILTFDPGTKTEVMCGFVLPRTHNLIFIVCYYLYILLLNNDL